MNIEEIEALVRKYLSTGIAIVVILVAPGTDGEAVRPGDAEVTVIEGGAAEAGSSTEDADGESASESDGDRTGAAGTDPEQDAADLDTDEDTTDRDSTTTTAEEEEEDQEPDSDAESGSEESNGSASTGDESADESATDSAARSADETAAETDTGTGSSAAERGGWGTPNREDDFSGGVDQWNIYDGPGHAGNGTRSPSAVSVDDGILTITGDSTGTTAGMAWDTGQKYGRWEGRVRAPAGDESYNALLLLWPDAEDFPVGGEIDFMEMMDPARQKTDIFVHYGADNSQVNGQVEVDGTDWHNWAVEWTPEAITAYVDGEEWYRNTDTSTFPPGSMHLCIQLDWFPEGGDVQESSMQVDWVRQYSLDGAGTDGRDAEDADGGGDDGDRTSDDETSTDEDAVEPISTARLTDRATTAQLSPVREAIRRMFSWT